VISLAVIKILNFMKANKTNLELFKAAQCQQQQQGDCSMFMQGRDNNVQGEKFHSGMGHGMSPLRI
jgi:succinate dehydrogenase/fumarate reductase-like Fe-S protein